MTLSLGIENMSNIGKSTEEEDHRFFVPLYTHSAYGTIDQYSTISQTRVNAKTASQALQKRNPTVGLD